MKTALFLSAGAIVAACSTANAGIYAWDWTRGQPVSAGISDAGGTLHSISTTFDTDTNRLAWSVTFSNQVTDGFTLVLSPGPNPKGHPGELAIVYFDSKNMGAPRASVYNYNGENTLTSYRDGSPASGTQAPDVITNTTFESGVFESISAVDADGKRTLSFVMNATGVNSHLPLYPNPNGNDWTGVAFGEKVGVWLHPIKNLSRSYNDGGFLTSWSGTHGWMDGNNISTRLVPTPGAAALAGVGGLLMVRRKRA